MLSITATSHSDQFSWQAHDEVSDELIIIFNFLGKLGKRAALSRLEKKIGEQQIQWIKKENKSWLIDLDLLKRSFKESKGDKLLRGQVRIEPEIEDTVAGSPVAPNYTSVSFIISKSEIVMLQSRKIFLSHKGKDKKLVRRFQRALEAIGYDVWIDEKNLKAGDHLERGILKGFKESCAAVFFLTDNFKDEKYLKTEINYAVEQTREKENYFKIITLALRADKEQTEIPELLKGFVWKSPGSELDGLTEIIKALPIAPRDFDFRP